MPFPEQNALSYISHTYWLSLEQLGQYIRRDASNVVGSQYTSPIISASLRAIGSYSSAVTVWSRGIMTLNLGE